jgi:hypothetical protein
MPYLLLAVAALVTLYGIAEVRRMRRNGPCA